MYIRVFFFASAAVYFLIVLFTLKEPMHLCEVTAYAYTCSQIVCIFIKKINDWLVYSVVVFFCYSLQFTACRSGSIIKRMEKRQILKESDNTHNANQMNSFDIFKRFHRIALMQTKKKQARIEMEHNKCPI